MQIERYLRRHQPIIYKTFLNALENDHLSHAYLISGAPGTPLLETAKYLAKTILCDDQSPMACNNCITCLRIDDDNYPDFIVLDGEKKTIQKNEITAIETQFEKKAFEAKGIMVYILHLVENMTVQAVNSILKFLEEPGTKIYAFLTTQNESAILPTIISRCQGMRLKLIDREQIISEAIEIGVEQIDAELLSYFYNDAYLIQDILNSEDKDSYLSAKEGLNDLLEKLQSTNRRELIFYVETYLIPKFKSKESMRFFLDMLIQIYENILNIQNHKSSLLKTYDTILTDLANKLNNVDRCLVELLKSRNMINSNVNLALLLDHVAMFLMEE